MKSRCTTYLLIMILSVQILPVKEWGKVLYNSSFQEEICESFDCTEHPKDSGDTSLQTLYLSQFNVLCQESMVINTKKIHFTLNQLLAQFYCEIPTPPPLQNA